MSGIKSLDEIAEDAGRRWVAGKNAEDWSDAGLERLRQAVDEAPEDRSTGFLVVFFAIVGFALGCLATAAVLYLKAWGG